MSFGLGKAAAWWMRKESLIMLLPLAGYLVGRELDRAEVERLTLFRDKSALFGRELGPNEKPSWP